MLRLNSDVLMLVFIAALCWGYSRWLLATEYRRYRRPRLWVETSHRKDHHTR